MNIHELEMHRKREAAEREADELVRAEADAEIEANYHALAERVAKHPCDELAWERVRANREAEAAAKTVSTMFDLVHRAAGFK